MAWNDHTSLNDSVIVRLFQGQLKSTVTCLTCRKRSTTFDPFMYVVVTVVIVKLVGAPARSYSHAH